MLLYFKDRGWDVLTASWTLAAKGHNDTEVVYLWIGEAPVRITLKTTLKVLLARIAASVKICDLTDIKS